MSASERSGFIKGEFHIRQSHREKRRFFVSGRFPCRLRHLFGHTLLSPGGERGEKGPFVGVVTEPRRRRHAQQLRAGSQRNGLQAELPSNMIHRFEQGIGQITVIIRRKENRYVSGNDYSRHCKGERTGLGPLFNYRHSPNAGVKLRPQFSPRRWDAAFVVIRSCEFLTLSVAFVPKNDFFGSRSSFSEMRRPFYFLSLTLAVFLIQKRPIRCV